MDEFKKGEGEMVILYSTHCPMCNALKQRLDEAKIEYQIETDVEKIQQLGFTTVPILQVNDKLMTYREALSYISNLDK